jgi:hypothetical protein
MVMIGEMFRHRRLPSPPWLPQGDGRLLLTTALLELAYEQALEAARASVGADAELGVGWIALSDPMVAFNSFSRFAQREARVWAGVDGAKVLDVRRATTSRYETGPPQWRADPSWRDLLMLSWARESPLEGTVTLWPRWYTSAPGDDQGKWRIEYRAQRERVTEPPRSFILGNDQELISARR